MKVFASRAWGFQPEALPIITFGLEGNRDRLLRDSAPGDVIAFVGTLRPPTADEERGRILGMAEIGRVPVDTADVVDRANLRSIDFAEDGRLRFPKAIAMLRAWRFTPQPLLTETLTAQRPARSSSGSATRKRCSPCPASRSLSRARKA